MTHSFSLTVKVCALLVLLAAGALLSGPAGISPGGAGISADHGDASGQSFTFLEASFTQEVFGVSPHFMGGVAFAPDGDPWVDDCTVGSHLHRYDAQGVAPAVNSTKLHPESVVASSAGCGLTNHPDGFMYSNTGAGAGVVQLNASTGAATALPAFGAAGNGLGIAPNPANGELVYVGADGTILTVPAGGASATFSTVTTGNFVDGIFFGPGGKLHLANRSPSFRVTVLNPDGTLDRHIPLPSEPDGIAFHSAGGFIVTNNLDGTMSKIIPGPDTVSLFASGGFRGDLSQVGADGCLYLTQNGTRYDDGTVTGENSLVKLCPGFVPPGTLDGSHYTCYNAFGVFVGQPVQVDNQFMSDVAFLADGLLYCPPTEKNAGGIPTLPALRCFAADSGFAGGQTVVIEDQYGVFAHTIGPLQLLCVPAVKGAGEPDTLPYYACYNSEGIVPTDPDPVISNQFITETLTLFNTRVLVCVPSLKAGDGTLALPTLTCYLVNAGTSPNQSVSIQTQFGIEPSVFIEAPVVFCTKATKLEPTKLAWPGDTDGDGCPDVNENLGKEFATQGGGRDWEDPYDWYDVNQDGVIDLLFDILGVINHYSPTGAPPYDIVFDRGPTTGPNAWNMTAPDGVIDLLNDILGVILQYSPTGCTEP